MGGPASEDADDDELLTARDDVELLTARIVGATVLVLGFPLDGKLLCSSLLVATVAVPTVDGNALSPMSFRGLQDASNAIVIISLRVLATTVIPRSPVSHVVRHDPSERHDLANSPCH